ncbi:MAG TPA: efflux RND transporter periplasmic adaptor subunit [Arenimonas sp.]|uniref:efflux RND transporter periplasmic adaptor subunit n=1 Tax=Arenimonas sp. TaxID=1872635 RepID=UPI002D7F277C|nr:efflux RND transporter periplasmic adaptor subunit [Arenimonas sp.]HEU0154055.1 efflux RND transporter periplasmic adaptor subunit [Arenimonas sp.]
MSSANASPRPIRRLLVAVAVLGLAVLAWWAWSARAPEAGGGFRTGNVDRGEVRVLISATGTLRATTTVDVGSQVSGQMQEVLVDFNDRVEKDQPIARLDPAPFQSRVKQTEADLASARASVNEAQATLKNAEADYVRKADLAARQLIARNELDLALAARDQARARVVSAQAGVQQRQAAVDNARLDVSYTVIRSPVDGVILLRAVEPGQTVAASFQTPVLFQIAEDLGQMQIDLSIDEADVGQIKEGLPVSFTVDAFRDRQFVGEVKQVRLSATSNANVISYPVVVQVDNADQSLLPGMTASAEIVVSRREDVLRVPNAALRFTPPGADAAAAPGAGRGGFGQDLPRIADALQLDATQRAAFDAAQAAMQERMAARMAARPAGGAPSPGAMGAPGGAAPSAEAIRQRMAEAFSRNYAEFRDTLSPEQRARWDEELRALTTARRGVVWVLDQGQPRAVPVRLGVSDGTVTEVSGELAEGDALIIGQERPAA